MASAAPSSSTPAAKAEAKPSNLYIHRQAGTPRSCFICYKQTPHVLVSSTVPSLDFFYVCLAHLGDTHFAKRVSTPAAPPSVASTSVQPDAATVSQADIDRVKKEYDERQRKLKEKKEFDAAAAQESDKKGNKPSSMTSSIFSTLSSAVSSVASAATSAATSSPSSPASTAGAAATPAGPTSPTPTTNQSPLHSKYALHREFYSQRLRDWNNRQAKIREKQLNLPRVPNGAPS
ncbi:uncharacterized protein PFL1_06775 [Pseudozyma flocculosa PF-1]|uniref:DUF1742-domain-containing protein n=2 Tax=Pseudozyma flocculosa TaxID=84751 RepID=A0A5C3FC71_9BASI|nr:uncharacterized protein PFL1_06775 [Pseudozyma flocculosa PF-1]EPQ25638.1 hypothetical protein PFL1_06775 [Pseudozyma flocculosa PF-1]SPO42044.1 uncharacterized protein PSFLO_07527 [Pseudozyma flocculosa]